MQYFSDIDKNLKTYDIKIEKYVATDGIARIIKLDVNTMTNQEFDLFLNYHLSICERLDLIGYSGHILAIAQK